MRRLREGLSNAGAALWDATEDGTPSARSWLPRYGGVVVAVVALLVLRRIDGVTRPQFWAEDGTVFFQQNFVLGCWHALREPFLGFPYLGQRLVACAATPFPLVSVPLVYHVVSYLLAGAALSTFSLPHFRHVVRSDALRVVFCLVLAGLPQATELVASATNVGWYLAIWLVLVTIARLPRSAVGLALLSIGVLVATFTTPLVVLTAPLWIARAVHAARRGRLREVGFAAVALGGIVALLALAGPLGRGRKPMPSLPGPVVNTVATRVLAEAALGPDTVQRIAAWFDGVPVYAIALGTLFALGLLARLGRWRSLPVLIFCAYGIVASSVLTLAGRPLFAWMAVTVPKLLGFAPFSARYQVLGVALVYLAVVCTVREDDGLRLRHADEEDQERSRRAPRYIRPPAVAEAPCVQPREGGGQTASRFLPSPGAGSTITVLTSPEGVRYAPVSRDARRSSDTPTIPGDWTLEAIPVQSPRPSSARMLAEPPRTDAGGPVRVGRRVRAGPR